MNAREYFEDIKKRNRLINIKIEELERLKALCELKGTNFDSVGFGGGGKNPDKSSNLVRYVEAKKSLDGLIDELVDKRLTAIELCGMINDVKKVNVLYELYFKDTLVTDLAEKYSYTEQRVYQLRNEALNELDTKHFNKF